MAIEKKPSSGVDSGKFRSSEELETYGVWVKSEPQEVRPDMAFPNDAVPFAGPSMEGGGFSDTFDEDPFAEGFDAGLATGFGSEPAEGSDDMALSGSWDTSILGSSSSNFDGLGFSYSEDMSDDYDISSDISFLEILQNSMGPESSETVASSSGDEASSKMLLRIADELALIKSEIATIKKEMSEMRGSGRQARSGGEASDFFSDDEGIAIMDEDMGGILDTADFVDVLSIDMSEDGAFDDSPDDDDPAPDEAAFDGLDMGDETIFLDLGSDEPSVEAGGQDMVDSIRKYGADVLPPADSSYLEYDPFSRVSDEILQNEELAAETLEESDVDIFEGEFGISLDDDEILDAGDSFAGAEISPGDEIYLDGGEIALDDELPADKDGAPLGSGWAPFGATEGFSGSKDDILSVDNDVPDDHRGILLEDDEISLAEDGFSLEDLDLLPEAIGISAEEDELLIAGDDISAFGPDDESLLSADELVEDEYQPHPSALLAGSGDYEIGDALSDEELFAYLKSASVDDEDLDF
ncbi:MAG: hypothetical protein FWE09_07305, partial [Treponema sp.]|nr:hypothetical protein [Treponema sp.]